MNGYRCYFDRVTLTPEQEARLADGARRRAGGAGSRRGGYLRYGAAAAVLALVCAGGWTVWRAFPSAPGGDRMDPAVGSSAPAREDGMVPLQYGEVDSEIPGSQWAEGWKQEAEQDGELFLSLVGGDSLSWDDFQVSAAANYNAEGEYQFTTASGRLENDPTSTFCLTVDPDGEIGSATEGGDYAVTNVMGVPVSACRVDGDAERGGLGLYSAKFNVGKFGVWFAVSAPDGEWASELCTQFVNGCIRGGEAGLNRLYDLALRPVPRDETMTPDQAREEAVVGAYVPDWSGTALSFVSARREVDSGLDRLTVQLSDGGESGAEIVIEGRWDNQPRRRVNKPETYDVRLNEDRKGWSAVFNEQDMTADVVAARLSPVEDGGDLFSGSLSVRYPIGEQVYPGGTQVRYTFQNVTMETALKLLGLDAGA